jgi:predicted nucleic acid-binding protein
VIVGIDTMILIWAMPQPQEKGTAPKPYVVEMQRRAKLLLRELAAAEDDIVAPTITASEWLCGIKPTKHGSFLAALQESFILAPFDLPAVALAARLFQEVRQLPKSEQSERPRLKADVMIVATAKVAGARRFYSHDEGIRKYAKMAGMEPKDLPVTGSDLFAEIPDHPPPKKPKK